MLSAEERNAYAENNLKLAYWFARKYQSRFRQIEPEEINGYALLGLALAVDRFDPELGYAFSTFLGTIILRLLLRTVKKQRVQTVSLETPLAENLTLCDRIRDETNYENVVMGRIALETVTAHLSPVQQEILIAYAEGAKQNDIAAAMGISQAHVSRIITRTRKRLLALEEGRERIEKQA